MSASDRTALWDRLDAAGLVEGAAPSAAADAVPWYVRAMVGIAGWIAACFLLAFVGGAVAFAFRTGGALGDGRPRAVRRRDCALVVVRRARVRRPVRPGAESRRAGDGRRGALRPVFAARIASSTQSSRAFELALALAVPYSIHRTWSDAGCRDGAPVRAHHVARLVSVSRACRGGLRRRWSSTRRDSPGTRTSGSPCPPGLRCRCCCSSRRRSRFRSSASSWAPGLCTTRPPRGEEVRSSRWSSSSPLPCCSRAMA